jgi:hypothetical protein
VQPFRGGSRVRPGHNATYAIFVWSTRATSKHVNVSVSAARAAHISSARFTVCATSSGPVCNVGNLPVGQTDEVQARIHVRPKALAGEHIGLTAKARANGAGSAKSSATVAVTAAPTPVPTATPTPTTGTLPPVPAPVAPQPGTTPSDPSNLFPTVSPGASTSTSTAPSGGQPTSNPGTHDHSRVKVATDAATVPLSPRLIGGQLIGLVVLAGAIVIAIARLSLRSRRPQGADEQSK